ncbi:MAG: ribosome biogenesis GTP-binding protein YsxC [Candidatus Moranbacteria bacterium]|nr:ribosome biogenesis GTP-binding protein YsxC [Candidatus Moranbacteria bacterium]
MEISSAQFLKGVIGSEGLPQPERLTVAFFGRSNVGKSSVINSLVRQKDLARSSSRPGRTTEINYFLINGTWHLADTPGYGYAKLPLAKREKIRKHLLWYAENPEAKLSCATVIVDAEIGAQDSDREMIGILAAAGRTVVIIANKADKGKRNDIANHIRILREEFPDCTVVRYSAKTGEGRSELLDILWPEKQ